MKENVKNNKGITLIALIITIIILLILAGVTLHFTLGENGILRNAEVAGNKYSAANVKETIDNILADMQMEAIKNGNKLDLNTIAKNLTSKDSNITLGEYNEGDIELKGIYTINGQEYNFTINNKFETSVSESTDNKIVKIENIIWENGKPKVELTSSQEGTIEYKDENGEWKPYNENVNLNNGDTIIVRVNMGSGTTKEEIIKLQDTIPPTEFEIEILSSNIKFNEVTVNLKTMPIDKETGLKDYTYVAEDSKGKKEITNITDVAYTITELTEETKYKIYVLAYDNAGNSRKSNALEISTLGQPIDSSLFGANINYVANGISEWKLFYADSNQNMYLITSDVLPVSSIPINEIGATVSGTGVYWKSVPAYSNITDEVRNKFIFTWNRSTTMKNIICVSKLLDTNIWNIFANGNSGSTNIEGSCAIGSPTFRLYAASWNELYPNNKMLITENAYGEIDDWRNWPKGGSALFTVSKNYWLSSPTKDSTNSTQYPRGIIYYNSYSSNQRLSCSNLYSYQNNNSLRPVVYIPNTYKLKWNSEINKYDIVQR